MGIMHRFLSQNVSLVVAVTFLTQLLPFGNAAFAFPSQQPASPSPALVSPSFQGKGLVESNGLFLVQSDGWEPLNKAGSRSSKIAPSRETNGEWAPIRNESPVATSLNPSKSAEGLVGNNGGIVADPALGVQVTIGPESLTKSTRITISRVKASPPLLETPPPEGIRIIEGPTFDLGPSGLLFQKPVQVSVSPSLQFREYLKKDAELEVGYWNGKIWQPVLESLSDDKGTIYFETDHFSVFTILATVFTGTVIVVEGALLHGRLKAWKRPWEFITPNNPSRNGVGGVHPDISVPKTLENMVAYSNGEDVELDYAVQALQGL